MPIERTVFARKETVKIFRVLRPAHDQRADHRKPKASREEGKRERERQECPHSPEHFRTVNAPGQRLWDQFLGMRPRTTCSGPSTREAVLPLRRRVGVEYRADDDAPAGAIL
jgi:hypothetical protein